jgi:hypothetical protein
VPVDNVHVSSGTREPFVPVQQSAPLFTQSLPPVSARQTKSADRHQRPRAGAADCQRPPPLTASPATWVRPFALTCTSQRTKDQLLMIRYRVYPLDRSRTGTQ